MFAHFQQDSIGSLRFLLDSQNFYFKTDSSRETNTENSLSNEGITDIYQTSQNLIYKLIIRNYYGLGKLCIFNEQV